MPRYANRGGDSNVISYEIGDGSIEVTFADGSSYLYTNGSGGAGNIARMQALANSGEGLNGFINASVKHDYASKRG